MQWGEIANQLGVSRQMVNAVRLGKKRFSEAVEERLNELVDAPTSTDVNQSNVNQPHVNQKIDELTNQAASLSARMDSLDARLSSIEQLLLKVLARLPGK